MRLRNIIFAICTICLMTSCGDSVNSNGIANPSSGTTGSTDGSSSAQIIGKTYHLDIEDSSGSLADYGAYRIIFGNGTYNAPGDYHVSDSHGTYTIRLNSDQMTMSTNDYKLGRATWVFTYDTDGTSGTYVLTTISYGTQKGRFTTTAASQISIPSGAG